MLDGRFKCFVINMLRIGNKSFADCGSIDNLPEWFGPVARLVTVVKSASYTSAMASGE